MKEKKKPWSYLMSFPFHEVIAFQFTWRKRKYIEIKNDSKLKRQTSLDRHG
jgi:hypothetical protein